jgi:hypothetical protein
MRATTNLLPIIRISTRTLLATSYGVAVFVILNDAVLGVFWAVSHIMLMHSNFGLTLPRDNCPDKYRSCWVGRITVDAFAYLVDYRATNYL